MITADYDLVPDDPYEYRSALIQAFRSRGIVPEDVNSYSEESLLWCAPEVIRKQDLPRCEGLEFDVFSRGDTDRRQQQQRKNARILHKFATDHAKLLGLSRDPKVAISARTFHEVHRISPDGRLNFDMVAELTQHRDIPLAPDDLTSPEFTFRGGTTLIINQDGQVRYAIQKSIGEEKHDKINVRLQRQRDYMAQLEANLSLAAYEETAPQDKRPMRFGTIHRGY